MSSHATLGLALVLLTIGATAAALILMGLPHACVGDRDHLRTVRPRHYRLPQSGSTVAPNLS
jgi:hypothetical protein